MSYKIEVAKLRNKFSIQKINHQCLPEKYDIDTWDDIIKNGIVVIIKDASEFIIGYCAVTDIFTTVPCIVSIAVLPKYRGNGLGNLLMTSVIDHTKKRWKDTQLILHVRPSSVVARKLYEKHGFVFSKTIKDYYRYETGNEDGIEMVLDI